MKSLALFVVVGACAGAPLHHVTIVNKTTRSIDELYVYPAGAAEHGASRGTLAPSAQTELQIHGGNIEISATSGKIQIDDTTRDRPSASTQVELTHDARVIFYDEGDKPALPDGVYGAKFHIPAARAAAPSPSP